MSTRKSNQPKRKASRRRGPPQAIHGKGTMVTVPHRMVRLRYHTVVGITEAAAGAGASYTFCLNNVFDPDFTSTGLQPLGLDQFAQFYGRYQVMSFEVNLDLANITGTANPVKVGMYASVQSTLPASPNAWFVQPTPFLRTAVMSPTQGGRDVMRLRMKVNIADVFGVTKEQYTDEADFSAVVTSSPARQAYLHICILSASAASTVRCYPELTYVTEFSQPVALGLS